MKENNVDAIRHYYRGRIHETVGEYELATEEYNKAIDLGCSYADILNALGRVLLKRGYYEEAEFYFQKALKINPQYLDAKNNLEQLAKIKNSLISKRVNGNVTNGKLFEIKSVKKKVKILLFTCFILVFIISALYYYLLKNKYNLQMSYNVDYDSVSGILLRDNFVIISDWSSQDIVFYVLNKGKLYKEFVYSLKRDGVVPTSISSCSKYIWILDSWNKKLYKYLMDKSKIIIIKIFNLSEVLPISVVCTEKNIVILDSSEKKINIYDKDFNRKDSIDFVVQDLIALSSYKNTIWGLDKNNYLYKIRDLSKVIDTLTPDVLFGKTISAFYINDSCFWFSEQGKNSINCYPKKILR